MSYATDLANELKRRNNISKIGSVKGKVLSINPIKIGILDNKIMVDSSNMHLCNKVSDLMINNNLNVNDEVLVIANESDQTFFIVDKIV